MFERFFQFFKLRGDPEEELASARRQLDIAWHELGGPSGQEVTIEQILRVLAAEPRLGKECILETPKDINAVIEWLEKKKKSEWRSVWIQNTFPKSTPHVVNQPLAKEARRRAIACIYAADALKKLNFEPQQPTNS